MDKRLMIIVLSIITVALCGCNSNDSVNSVKKMSGGEIITDVEEKITNSQTESVTLQSQPEEESVTESLTVQETTEATYQLTETNDTMYAVSVVNVRSMPSVEGNIITVLNRGDGVQRIGTLDNGWSKISINDTDCYVNTVYLTNEPPTVTQTENNTTVQETTTAPVISTPKDAKQIAQSYVGKTMDSLKEVIGAEVSQVHAASCYYEGEMDGIFYYSDFTIYTHTVNGVDYIDYVE